MSLHVISDVHGQSDKYLDIIKRYKYSVQLGDMGFDYSFLNKVDPTHHKFIKGNHECYSEEDTLKSGHNLGDFGYTRLGGVSFFFVRGEHSIDQGFRRPFIDWFPNEQLSWKEGVEAIELYRDIKPKIVITHGAPMAVSQELFPDRRLLQSFGYDDTWTSSTSVLLQLMLDIHKPDLWVFGHMHQKVDKVIQGTRFRCMYELGVIEI